MKRYISFLLIPVLTISIWSCGQSEDKGTAMSQESIAVTVFEVSTGDDSSLYSASGRVEAILSADLSTRMMGHVTLLPFSIGDKVKKGQLVVALSNTDLNAKLGQVNAGINEAQAAYNNALRDFERFKNLHANQSASQKELDDATMRFEMAQSRLESARQMKNEVNAQFSYSNIRAPFDGTITAEYVKKGDLANPGIPLISMENSEELEIKARIPEYLISSVKTGLKVEVEIKSINKIIAGSITEISNSSIKTGGQYVMTVKLDERPGQIQSGMFASVNVPVETGIEKKTVMIPRNAIHSRGQLSGVFTVSQSDTSILRWLRLGESHGEYVEVLSGLTDGETVILSSEAKLYNGASITIQEGTEVQSKHQGE